MKFNGIDFTSERLLHEALQHLDRSQGDVDTDFSGRLTQQSIAYSLLAIGQELAKLNWESNYEDSMERVRSEYETRKED